MSAVIAREILNYMVRGEVIDNPSLLTDRQTEILEGLMKGLFRYRKRVGSISRNGTYPH